MNQLLALTITVISLLLPAATAIKCYQCVPNPVMGETCAKPTNITTCESMYDSCMITSITMNVPNVGEVTSDGMACGLKAQCPVVEEAVCKGANSTGMVTKCTVKCCSEDLCNTASPTVSTTMVPTTTEAPTTISGQSTLGTNANPTSSGQRAVPHLIAIFTAAVLPFRLC